MTVYKVYSRDRANRIEWHCDEIDMIVLCHRLYTLASKDTEKIFYYDAIYRHEGE